MKKALFSIVLLFCVVIINACAPASKSTPVPANFPTGKFLKSGTANHGYIFNADGTWSLFDGMFTVAKGTYSIEGNVYTETSNDTNCGPVQSFTYTFDGKNLTFNYVGKPEKDVCINRTWDMNNVTYTLVKEPVQADGAALPEIKIEAADYSYIAPEKVTAGWVRVILTNSGTEPHHVQFLRLNDGVTVQQFEDALKQAEGPALAMTKQVGGVGAIHPGGSAQAVIKLPAGQYVILCLIPSPSDHMAHHTKGMIKSLSVDDGDNQAREPSASLTVQLKDFMFDMPDTLLAGQTVIKVTNIGPEPHELNILRLEDGKTVEDARQFLLGTAGGPPPFAPVGGMNGLDMGLSGYAELNLTPGNYVAVCNIPSPKGNGAPHFAMGMIKQFTVQ